MTSTPIIRLLERDANKRGDLFGRRMEDLFLALGYEQFRLNIHKSGREIDLEGIHRTERRKVIAERKATVEPVGGDEVNKFYGAYDIERRKLSGQECVGYFVSLSGFRETTIEQEADVSNQRLILINSRRIVDELVRGSIIATESEAIEIAARAAAASQCTALVQAPSELVAHSLGWLWVVRFGSNKEVTHFALVHADGELLSTATARQVIEADREVGGDLHKLIYLGPVTSGLDESILLEAKEHYLSYIERECGEMQLEGLPADQDVGSRRLNIENIFVPLHLSPLPDVQNEVVASLGRQRKKTTARPRQQKRLSIGKVLSESLRLAILGFPGAGKSTLLKRIAIAYGFPARRNRIADQLPKRNWLPLFLRCRQLDQQVRSSITEILLDIAIRAEIELRLRKAFHSLISDAITNGTALLLIDGLDEISSDGDRVAFVQQLRIFMAKYPAVGVIITSREAGFRIIGAGLAGLCAHFRLSDFDDADIRRLTVAWHKEVIGNKSTVVSEAEKVAGTICSTDRVRRLAQNPLLLTTLLLVKRWVGQLPTRRSVLYGKAVEVLLMTWNVEGHEPLDQEEVLPQLEFVAYTMLSRGIQRISLKRLREILDGANSDARDTRVVPHRPFGVY
jgi:hypothetical protein